ncbi:MAG: hypothetical protein K2W85_15185 [Phycisphaerales bacterium]|nr:hypothetical protein [Phycisphaerales bacterium]
MLDTKEAEVFSYALRIIGVLVVVCVSGTPLFAQSRNVSNVANPIAIVGQSVPGVPGATFQAFEKPRVSANGMVVFWATWCVSGTGIFAWTQASGLRLVVAEGQIAPGFSSTFRSFSVEPTVNGSGIICFRASLDDGPSGIWFANTANNPATLTAVVSDGQVAGSGAILDNIFSLSTSAVGINNVSTILFTAPTTINGTTAITLWRRNASTGNLTSLYRDGDPAPNPPSGLLTAERGRLIGFGLNGLDQVMVAQSIYVTYSQFGIVFDGQYDEILRGVGNPNSIVYCSGLDGGFLEIPPYLSSSGGVGYFRRVIIMNPPSAFNHRDECLLSSFGAIAVEGASAPGTFPGVSSGRAPRDQVPTILGRIRSLMVWKELL